MRKKPYRIRTWLRGRTPWFLINKGLFAKGADCEAAGGIHEWHRWDDLADGCLHCLQVRPYSSEWWERWEKKYGTKDNFGFVQYCDKSPIEETPSPHSRMPDTLKKKEPIGDEILSIENAPWAANDVHKWLIKTWGKMDITYYLESLSRSRCRMSSARRKYPKTFVYLRNNFPIGTISMVEDEILDDPKLNPWASCLYVAKDFRHQGIAAKLIAHAIMSAARNDEKYLYQLIDKESRRQSFAGWDEISGNAYPYNDMKIFRINIKEASKKHIGNQSQELQ